ncbi:MAG: M48 family metallopeptidase [Nitrospinae bacterium]|nr:M48 family metallopeptidase [Nitrospinota bacterium]MBL7020352.1 M48 family metallopeptidase [Nitrospinaceae bacterium]
MTARKLQFAGTLFDGKSARKHPVDIALTPREIILKKPGHEPIHWFYGNLRWAAKTTSPFHIEHGDINNECLETLVVEDPDFYESVSKIAPDNFSDTGRQTEINWKIYAAGILILIFSAYVFIKTVPSFLADRMVDKIPVEWEVTLGQSILKMLPLEQKPDQQVLAVLQETVDLLERSVEGKQPYDLQVYIWPGKTVNALALPGGPIVVFEGLLNQAESPEELAGVIAHEIQHILLRHSTRGILRNMAQSMLLALFIGDVNAVMEGVANLAGELETLGLSRDMEAEADQKGMELILTANIDPRGMMRIFEKLMEVEPENSPKEKTTETDMELFSYFSTHPSSQSRLAKLEKQMEPHKNKTWAPLFPNLNWNEIKPEN